MEEQIKGFNKAYKKAKKLGFGNYFCLAQTTWEKAHQNFKEGKTLGDPISIMVLQENVNLVLGLTGKKLPYCKTCGHLFSDQEFKSGFEECEHCAGHCGCHAIKEMEVINTH